MVRQDQAKVPPVVIAHVNSMSQPVVQDQVVNTWQDLAYKQADAVVDEQQQLILKQRMRESSGSTTIIVMLVVLASVYTVLKTQNLQIMYPQAYLWWEQTRQFIDAGHMIKPNGTHPLITVPRVALRLNFPAYYSLETFRMVAQSMHRSAAEFLMIMATNFSETLRPVHWNGSAEQLRANDIEDFLPLEQPDNWTYIWTKFNALNAKDEQVNPWGNGVLFQTPEQMMLSPAVRAYYNNDPSYMKALYEGGLVQLAMTHATASNTGTDLVKFLMGSMPVSGRVECGAGQLSRSQQESMTGTMLVAVISIALTIFVGRNMIGKKVMTFATRHATSLRLLAGAAVTGSAVYGYHMGSKTCETNMHFQYGFNTST